MNFSKVKELYFKYQLAFTLAVSTSILIISTFWNPAQYISVGFVIISYIFSSVEDICAGTFYFMLYSGISVFFMSVAVGAILVLIGKYIFDACKKKVKIYKYILILTTIISVLFSLIHYQIDSYGILLGLYTIAILYFSYIVFCYHKELSFKRIFKYLFIGLIVSISLTLVLSLLSSAKLTRFVEGELIEVTIKEKMFLVYSDFYGSDFYRLELLTYHPNYLSIHCLMLICYGIYSLINYKQTKDDLITNLGMIIVPTIAGFLTLSKAFYVLLILILIYSICYLVYKFKLKSLKYIVPILLGIILICVVFSDPLKKTFERLLPNEDGNDFNDITTGRFEIWKTYFGDLLGSPLKLLFGEGLFTGYLGMGPHNFYLLILFRFGIVGTLMLIGLAVLYVFAYDGKFLFSLKRILPLAVFLIYSLQESEDDERIIFLVVTIILMFFITVDDKNFNIENLETKLKRHKIENKQQNDSTVIKTQPTDEVAKNDLDTKLEQGGNENAN